MKYRLRASPENAAGFVLLLSNSLHTDTLKAFLLILHLGPLALSLPLFLFQIQIFQIQNTLLA